MIGLFDANDEATILLRVRAVGGSTIVTFSATIDTGFTESLLLPRSAVEALDLLSLEQDGVILGDGTLARMDVYEVDVEWNGAWRRVKAYGGEDETLVGVSLLKGCRLTIDFAPGGEVRVGPL